MSNERDQASVRSISASARSTRSLGDGELSSPMKIEIGVALASSCITVLIDSSGRGVPWISAGRSSQRLGADVGDDVPAPLAAHVLPAHEALRVTADVLVGPQARRRLVHALVELLRAGLDAVHGALPQLMRTDAHSTQRERVTGPTPRGLGARQHAAADRTELLGDPVLAGREAADGQDDAGAGGKAQQRAGLGRVGEVLRRVLALADPLEHERDAEPDGDRDREALDAALGADRLVERVGGGERTRRAAWRPPRSRPSASPAGG